MPKCRPRRFATIGVPHKGFDGFLGGGWMKPDLPWLHHSRISRRLTSDQGTVSTCPASSSLIRRSISKRQAVSISSSTPGSRLSIREHAMAARAPTSRASASLSNSAASRVTAVFLVRLIEGVVDPMLPPCGGRCLTPGASRRRSAPCSAGPRPSPGTRQSRSPGAPAVSAAQRGSGPAAAQPIGGPSVLALTPTNGSAILRPLAPVPFVHCARGSPRSHLSVPHPTREGP